jgi:hypothetical protein
LAIIGTQLFMMLLSVVLLAGVVKVSVSSAQGTTTFIDFGSCLTMALTKRSD